MTRIFDFFKQTFSIFRAYIAKQKFREIIFDLMICLFCRCLMSSFWTRTGPWTPALGCGSAARHSSNNFSTCIVQWNLEERRIQMEILSGKVFTGDSYLNFHHNRKFGKIMKTFNSQLAQWKWGLNVGGLCDREIVWHRV